METKVIKDVIDKLLVEYSSDKKNNVIDLFLNKRLTKIKVLLDNIIIINLEPKHQNFILIPKTKFNFKETDNLYVIYLNRDEKYTIWNELQQKHFQMSPMDIKRQAQVYL